ncbi:Ig-like domain-containing protein, partial [Erwinia oleae]|uniref:Ig-like domain-containing protein n=1 Tax=Erwinia oleae TaxID=796334 RepID=UPI0005528733
MNLQLIVKDVKGKVVFKELLKANQLLSFKTPATAASLEIHSEDGQPPKKITAKKVDNNLVLEVVDESASVNHQIVLEDYPVSELPAVIASGPDGVAWAYEYDAVNGSYDLASVPVESIIAGQNILPIAAGGSLAATAMTVGLAPSSKKGSHRKSVSSESSDQSPAPVHIPDEENESAELAAENSLNRPVITDDEGNAIADGGTVTDNTPTLEGGGMQPGSPVIITDGDEVLGETVADEDGNWRFTPDAPLADGGHAIVVDGTDADGNPVSDTVNVIVDGGIGEESGTGENEESGESEEIEENSENDTGNSATKPVITDDEGNAIADGGTVTDNIYYVHYTSKTATGETVDLYVDRDITLSRTETAQEDNAADVTGQVEPVHEYVDQGTILDNENNSFVSDTFTLDDRGVLQNINVSVSGADVNVNNVVSIKWSLQVYNEKTFSWDTVTTATESLSSDKPLNVSLSDYEEGTYRVVVESTQSGHEGWFWSTNYDPLPVQVTVNIVSTTDYRVNGDSSITGSVFAQNGGVESTGQVKSVAGGIITDAASYTVVAAGGVTIAGAYGKLTLHQDGRYTYTLNGDSIIKLAGSEDIFTYVLADGTVNNLIMTVGVSVNGSEGGALVMAGSVGADSFNVYDTDFT